MSAFLVWIIFSRYLSFIVYVARNGCAKKTPPKYFFNISYCNGQNNCKLFSKLTFPILHYFGKFRDIIWDLSENIGFFQKCKEFPCFSIQKQKRRNFSSWNLRGCFLLSQNYCLEFFWSFCSDLSQLSLWKILHCWNCHM